MSKENLIQQKLLIEILTLAYTEGNNSSNITANQLIEEISERLREIFKDF